MSESDYFEALTNTMRLENEPELDDLRVQFPGLTVTATLIQSASSSGVTRYVALWRGHALTAYSFRGLLGQLRDISDLPDGV